MRIFSLFILTLVLALSVPVASAATTSASGGHDCAILVRPACWADHLACAIAANDSSGSCLPLGVIINKIPPIPPLNTDATLTTTTCENNGVVAMLTVTGDNNYCVGDACDNGGVIILISVTGTTNWCSYQSAKGGVCVADHCYLILPSPEGSSSFSARPQESECSNSGILVVVLLTGSDECCPSAAPGIAVCVEQAPYGALAGPA